MVTVINHKKLIFFLSCFMFCDVDSSPCSCSEFHKHKASNVLLQSCGFLFETCIALCQVPWPILHTPPPSNKNSTKINNTYCSASHKKTCTLMAWIQDQTLVISMWKVSVNCDSICLLFWDFFLDFITHT